MKAIRFGGLGMIRRLYSNLEKFKELRFRPGFNIVLSDKSIDSDDMKTRNRAGKSSMVEIIHFLFGGNCPKDSIFRNDALIDKTFGIEFDLGQSITQIERVGGNPSKIIVAKAEDELWVVKPKLNRKLGKNIISNADWDRVIGDLTFNIPVVKSDLYYGKNGPTFRSLFSYFARRQNSGGIMSPFANSSDQTNGNMQVNISFLLGLDWRIAQDWQNVRDQEKNLKELKRASKEGTFGAIIGSAADLRTVLTIELENLRRMKGNLENFQVLPEYKALEEEASQLSKQINEFVNKNTLDRQLILELEESLKVEEEPSYDELGTLYREVGVVLPNEVLRKYDDVKVFHDRIIQNRKLYLQSEMDDAYYRIQQRDKLISSNTNRRSELMIILKTHGAMEHFRSLQTELITLEAKVESLRQQYEVAEKLESGKMDLDIDRARLLQRLKQDYKEQSALLDQAILIFEEISQELYEKAGSLVISESANGPEFNIKIQGKESKGISNMQIFCFDMMIMRLCQEKGMGPGFLIHDSHIFDGVDERQIAKALEFAIKEVERSGFQYIVTMNSDTLPKSTSEDIDFNDYVLPVKLTDATDDGGLFGIRF